MTYIGIHGVECFSVMQYYAGIRKGFTAIPSCALAPKEEERKRAITFSSSHMYASVFLKFNVG